MAYLYDACRPTVYTVVLDHAATPPQLVPLVGLLPGAELLPDAEVPVPAHALTAENK